MNTFEEEEGSNQQAELFHQNFLFSGTMRRAKLSNIRTEQEVAATQQINQNKLAANTSVLMLLMPKFACSLIARQLGSYTSSKIPSVLIPIFLRNNFSVRLNLPIL